MAPLGYNEKERIEYTHLMLGAVRSRFFLSTNISAARKLHAGRTVTCGLSGGGAGLLLLRSARMGGETPVVAMLGWGLPQNLDLEREGKIAVT